MQTILSIGPFHTKNVNYYCRFLILTNICTHLKFKDPIMFNKYY